MCYFVKLVPFVQPKHNYVLLHGRFLNTLKPFATNEGFISRAQ